MVPSTHVVVVLGWLCGAAHATCSADADCSLNGVCTGGKCVCDVAWHGDQCQQLSLVAPKSVVPAYPPASWKGNTTSWGGSVVRAPTGARGQDGKAAAQYHMFLAEMLNGCGMQTWTTNSIIRHAVADTPAGPYTPKEIIMHPFAHNPTALRAPDGTYLIYHIGCGTPNGGSPCSDCSGGNTGKSCRGIGEMVACTKNTTNILYSKSLNGPWQQLNAPIVYSATMGVPYQVDNPTVTFFKNGSLLMLGRGGDPASEAGSDGYITAPSWKGPYTMHDMVGTPKSSKNPSPAVEGSQQAFWAGRHVTDPSVSVVSRDADPFVWQDKRGNFHALFHKFTDEHPGCGGHAFSSDGHTWTLHNDNAYTTTVTLADGSNQSYFRRERPHLLFDESGTELQMLFTTLTQWGVAGKGDSAFTFGQAIQTANMSFEVKTGHVEMQLLMARAMDRNVADFDDLARAYFGHSPQVEVGRKLGHVVRPPLA